MVLVTKLKHRAPTQHKRRQGSHHKKDEHYLKPYWPYLPLLLIILLGVFCSSLWGQAQKNVLGYATDMSITGLLNGTNSQRAANSLGSLALNSKLNQAAQAKANDMAARNYWAHNTPDGATPWTFFTNAGYNYQNAGENLAYGFDSSENAITAWMNSPEHKANIVGNYTEVGFGIANSSDYQSTGPETIVVAMYATPQVVVAPAPVASQPTPSASPEAAPAQEAPAPSPTPKEEVKPQATNKAATQPAKQSATNKPVQTKNVSRIQLITNGQAPWSMFVISVLAVVSAAVFLLRHGLFWHRALVKGEAFIMHHKLLDIALVTVGVIGFVLTRSAGVIH